VSPRRSATTSTDDANNGRDREAERFARRRERMVERQLRRRGITDERVLAAMGELPRERFLPDHARGQAYRDGAVRIGKGQTMSQPWIVAYMTQLLELGGDERVLEVGTGSGYGAAVLSRCAREVVTIERYAALAEAARAVLAEVGCDNVEVRTGDGSRGAPDWAPFGGISVTATASGEPPQALLDQLAPGAALVCPARRAGREHLARYRDGVEEQLVPVRFVALVSGKPEPDDSADAEENEA
jgi:protein-L-isoaspartate(D-aspartate) O-methyltransferase